VVVIFPIVPFNVVDKATHGLGVKVNVPPNMGGWPFGDPLCIKRYVWYPGDPNAGPPSTTPGGAMTCVPQDQTTCALQLEVCEQSPILPLGGAQITESVAGGTDYPA